MLEGINALSMDGAILHVGEGLIAERADRSTHTWVDDIPFVKLIFVVPPTMYMGFPPANDTEVRCRPVSQGESRIEGCTS